MINEILCKMWGHGKVYDLIGPNTPFGSQQVIFHNCIHCHQSIGATVPKGYAWQDAKIGIYVRDYRP